MFKYADCGNLFFYIYFIIHIYLIIIELLLIAVEFRNILFTNKTLALLLTKIHTECKITRKANGTRMLLWDLSIFASIVISFISTIVDFVMCPTKMER